MLKSGDARALAVTSDKRMTALPDVPTAAEAGVKNYETSAWLALLAPAGTPKPNVDRIYKALAEAVKDPTVKARLTEQGAEPVSPGPEELEKFMASETVKWRDIINKAGIPPM
jgi:tripartite-type tricarboxylate transporter receptor subunit TctC